MMRSCKKILKLTLLLLVRESYLYFRNLYGLICHPFLTIRKVEKDQDFSQGILLFGLPAYFWLVLILFLAVLRFLIGIRGDLGWIAYTSFTSITLLCGFLFLYVFYWFWLTLPNNRGGEK